MEAISTITFFVIAVIAESRLLAMLALKRLLKALSWALAFALVPISAIRRFSKSLCLSLAFGFGADPGLKAFF